MSVRERLGVVAPAWWPGIGKLKRMGGYGAVGLTGVPVDLGILEGLSLLGVHHLLAICISYLAAMTWNFTLQRRYVYRAVGGNAIRQFIRYFFVDVSAFAVRAGVVILTVDALSWWQGLPYIPRPIDPAVPASAVGIVLAFLIGFQGTDDVVFGDYT